MLSIVNSSNIEITLKEITDLIGVRHNDSIKKVIKLSEEPEFGAVRETEVVYNDKGQTTTTLILNEKQAIAAAAKLNNAMLMKVINRLEQLEKKNHGGAIASLKDMNTKLVALFQQGEIIGEVLTEHNKRIKDLESNRRLEAWQEAALLDAKNKTVYRIAGEDKDLANKLHRRVWQLFKKKFHLPRYNELTVGKYNEGIEYIRNLNFADMVV